MEAEQIKAAIKEVMDERMKEFYIDREEHYLDHQFLHGLREWTGSIRSTTVKTVVSIFVAALIGLMIMGFVVWGKNHMR